MVKTKSWCLHFLSSGLQSASLQWNRSYYRSHYRSQILRWMLFIRCPCYHSPIPVSLSTLMTGLVNEQKWRHSHLTSAAINQKNFSTPNHLSVGGICLCVQIPTELGDQFFTKPRCYDMVHQDRDVLPVVLMSSSSSESSPSGWSSSSSLLSVSLTSGWV